MQPSRVSQVLVAGLVAIALPVLSACEASIKAETQEPYTPGQGVWADTDDLKLRGVVAVAPTDGEATLVATILNEGTAGDTLTRVRFPGGRATLGRTPVSLPPGSARVLGVDTSLGRATPVALEGTSLRPGLAVPMTFEFQRAGTVTLNVLVTPAEGPFATVPAPRTTRAATDG